MKILVADDESLARNLLQFQLEQWGHSVLSAENGAQAWELFQSHDFQIVITDWMMPEMTGIDLLRKIRASDRAGYVYVILLTSTKRAKEDLVTGLTTGADEFLTKPVDPAELQARLQPSLRIIDLERRLAERNRELESRNTQLAKDITERKQAEEALRQANLSADAANRELEAFNYSVAHDLRAPLRSIDGFSLALLEDYADKLDQEGKTYLRQVRESAQKMAQLIDDLLELSRVSRGELLRERVDLAAIARTVLAHRQREWPDRTVELIIHADVVAFGDARLLSIVLENLLGNAWKFTGNRAQGRIEFGQQVQEGKTVYFVQDNGAGFDMAYVAKLFGVFQRLHLASEFEGTGIGLAIVQRIIYRHGGTVWAEGDVGRGATFYFTLGEFT